MKNKITKFSKVLIAGTVLIFGLVACNQDKPEPTPSPVTEGNGDVEGNEETNPMSKVAEIKGKGKIIMGTNATFYPFEYLESNGDVVGFDIEIGKKVAEKLGVDFEVEDLPFQSLLVSLAADSVDFVAAGMTIEPERLESAEFSDKYFDAKQVVLVLKDNDTIKTMDDLKDLRIGTQSSTTGEDIANELSENAVSFNAITIAAVDMVQDKLDALIVDIEPAKGIINTNEDIKMIELDDFADEEYAIAVNKLADKDGNAIPNDLLDVINEVLAELKETGEFQNLVNQFFGE